LEEIFNNASLSKYIFLWHDLGATQSYKNITGKKSVSQKNKMTRLRKVVNILSEYLDKDVMISPKPIGDTYQNWKENTLKQSIHASSKCFESLEGVQGMEKFQCIDEMSMSVFIRIIAKHERNLEV